MRPAATIPVLLGIFAPMLSAQTDILRIIPLTAADSNRAALGFERNINTYTWNFDGNVSGRDSLLSFRLADQFTSSLIRSTFVSYRDENTFGLSLQRDLSPEFALAGEAQSYVLSDNRSLDIGTAGIHTVVGGISYRPLPSVTITPMAGMRYDLQQGEEDDGVTVKVLMGIDSIASEESRASFSGQINQSDLHPRRFVNNAAQASAATVFSENSSDSIRVRWSDNRWDFYIPADSTLRSAFGVPSNIRTRREQLYGVQNYLSYETETGLAARLMTRIESRTIDNNYRYKVLSNPAAIPFNTSVQQFQIAGGLDLMFRSRYLFAMVGMDVGERDEKHLVETIDGLDPNVQDRAARQESKLDNTGRQTALHAAVVAGLSSVDTVRVNGSIGLFRYDTPDTVNTDDRDEQTVNLSVTGMHRFSRAFRAELTAEAALTHIVYLYDDKSANNNWNRIFRLSPVLSYTPSERFRMVNAFEVLANYTAFDFESVIPTVQSYSFRQVAFLDSTSYDMTEKLGIALFAHVRLFERGELHWDEFTERPQQYIEEVTFSPEVRYRYRERYLFAVGFRSFVQKRFVYTGTDRVYDGAFLSAGPTTHIVIALSPLSAVEIRGWKEFQHQSGQKLREYSNVTLNVRYLF